MYDTIPIEGKPLPIHLICRGSRITKASIYLTIQRYLCAFNRYFECLTRTYLFMYISINGCATKNIKRCHSRQHSSSSRPCPATDVHSNAETPPRWLRLLLANLKLQERTIGRLWRKEFVTDPSYLSELKSKQYYQTGSPLELRPQSDFRCPFLSEKYRSEKISRVIEANRTDKMGYTVPPRMGRRAYWLFSMCCAIIVVVMTTSYATQTMAFSPSSLRSKDVALHTMNAKRKKREKFSIHRQSTLVTGGDLLNDRLSLSLVTLAASMAPIVSSLLLSVLLQESATLIKACF